jgi:hypothetical protein
MWILCNHNLQTYFCITKIVFEKRFIENETYNTVWVPVWRNWRVYVKFVGTLPFPIIDCQNRKGSM